MATSNAARVLTLFASRSASRFGASSRRFRNVAPVYKQPTVASAFQIRSYSDDVAPLPGADIDPSVRKLVDEISGLTLLQVSELCSVLKSELNIADAPTGGGMMAPMMVAPVADGGDGGAEVEDSGPVMLTVKLESFEPENKIKLIKEVKKLLSASDPAFNLAKAKKFVESLPQNMGENLSQEDADKLKATLEAVGGKIVLE